MTGYLTDYNDKTYELPVLLGWDISHGMGSPCDAFEISLAYEESMLDMLSGAVRFRADQDGETVFLGVVDEFEISAGKNGRTAAVRGRSLAALLLDNEAEAADYYYASPQFILDTHVYPWGISDVRLGSLPTVAVFTVDSGASQWRVLENYAFFCGGIRPRFTRDGVLLLDGSAGERRVIEAGTAISAQVYRETRYGLISSILVKNKVWGMSSAVDNAEFLARGGACRRVVNVPRHTYYDAMRHTGEYQIERSREGKTVCELTVPALFTAFPGDTITLKNSPLAIAGCFFVSESRCWANGTSAGTRLIMEPVRD